MRKKLVILILSVLFLPAWISIGPAEEQTAVVAKVTTEKGSLKLRATADSKGRVLDEIPNGTCVLATEEGGTWCRVVYKDQAGYCRTSFLILLREADTSLLDYRVLRKGMKGDDVLAVKKRLQELGYIRSGSELTNVYNNTLAERIILFQRQTGMTEDGTASQELQAYLFSDKAPDCTQALPRVRSRVASQGGGNRVICGCCFGEGCECCDFTGWITY